MSIGGVEPSGPASGRQWFSVQGVTEENRQARIDAIMPVFIETVRYWQKQSGVGANATALIGFSQGAIMALESIKAEPGLASRVIAFNGRAVKCGWGCHTGYRGRSWSRDRRSQHAVCPRSFALYRAEALL